MIPSLASRKTLSFTLVRAWVSLLLRIRTTLLVQGPLRNTRAAHRDISPRTLRDLSLLITEVGLYRINFVMGSGVVSAVYTQILTLDFTPVLWLQPQRKKNMAAILLFDAKQEVWVSHIRLQLPRVSNS